MTRLFIIATLAIGCFGGIGYRAGFWFVNDPQMGRIQTDRGMAQPAKPYGTAGMTSAPYLVRIETITLPIQRQKSVTLVVADFAVAVSDARYLALYQRPEYSSRLRAEILDAMKAASGTTVLTGPAIDSAALSNKIRSQLQNTFVGVDDLLTLMLYKHDIGL